MTQVYMQNGKSFMPADSASLNVQPRLPVGTYAIAITPAGFHLEQVENSAKRIGLQHISQLAQIGDKREDQP